MISISISSELPEQLGVVRGDVLLRDDHPEASWPSLTGVLASGQLNRPRISVMWRRQRSLADLRRQIEDSGLGFVHSIIIGDPVLYGSGTDAVHRNPKQDLVSRWRELERLHADGVTRALGVWDGGQPTLAAILDMATCPPSATFVEYHPYLQDPELLRFCRDHGVTVHSYDPLASPDWLASNGVRTLLADPAVMAPAIRLGIQPAEVCLGWLHARGVVPLTKTPITTSATLQPDEIARLDALHRDCRIHAGAATLASIYGNLSAEPIEILDPDRPESGDTYLKVLYLQLTPWESVNQRVSHFVWRYVFNLPDTLMHLRTTWQRRRRHTRLSDSLVEQLNARGFARTTLGELGCPGLLQELQAGSGEIERLALAARAAGQYPFRYGEPRLAPLEGSVIKDVMDRYAGTTVLLRNAYGMTNVPVEFPAGAQRLWHVDVEDYYVLKVYVLMTDIDAFRGSLDYVDCTHPKGRFASQAAQLMKHTFRKSRTWLYDYQVPDNMLYRAIRPDAVTRIEGKAGDVLLFDARGIHRGGHVLSRTRHVGIMTFTGRHTIHGTFPPDSRWGRFCRRFTWKTNVRVSASSEAGAA